MEWYTKPISYYNKEFAKRFSCYEHPFTGERITTAQGYLNAIKSQAAGHLIEDKGYLSVEELNREFKEFYKDFMPPDGMPIMNMDDYLREMDIQETLKMKAAEKVIYKKEAEKEEKNHKIQKVQKIQETEVEEESTEEYDDDPLETLNSLIGLQSVKRDVNNLIGFVQMTKKREEAGLKALPVSLHMVFTGNPGTGKTTVARLLARVYKEIGLLSKGHLVEVDRSGLVSGYVGQTALKTSEVIESAMGGILFIDEAYSLVKGGNDFGQEAIDTLLKAMEDNRGDLVVIVAGYPDLMEKFITSNPGLKSRFSKILYFPDYNAQELEAVFYEFCDKYEYVLSDEAEAFLTNYMETLVEEKTENFANARDVRNFFEQAIRNQASRVMEMDNPTEEDLKTITVGDLNIRVTFMMKFS